MKIRFLCPTDKSGFNKALSDAAGMLKLYMGGPDGCCVTQMRNALDLLQSSSLWRHKVKNQFKKAETELAGWRYRLLHPDEGRLQLRLFHLEDFTPESRERYRKDMTDTELVEFWEGLGGALYVKTLPYFKSLIWKFEKHLRDNGYPSDTSHTIGYCIAVDWILRFAVEVYDVMAKEMAKPLPPTTITLAQMCSILSLRRVQEAWHQGTDTLIEHTPPLNEFEKSNITVAARQIHDLWSNPTTYAELTRQAVEDWKDDIFANKKTYRKVVKACNEEIKNSKNKN